MKNLNNRNDISVWLELLGFTSGAELGVQRGIFALNNLQRWTSCKKYILVDLWHHQDNYKDTANVDDKDQELLFKEAKNNLKVFSNKTEFIRNFTTSAALLVPDNSLDFIYVDARHDYCGCKQDIEQWWPKLKPGGIMAGHDYVTVAFLRTIIKWEDWSICQDGSKHEYAVMAAVDEVAAALNVKVFTTNGDGPFVSWFYSPKPYPHTSHNHHSNHSSLNL
eukprot:gene10306-13852_t